MLVLNSFSFLLMVTLSLFSLKVFANSECQTDIELGIIINKNHVRYIDHNRTVVQFNTPHQLIIQGEVITLDKHQQQLVKLYINSLQQGMPQYIDLVMSGSMLVAEYVEHLAAGLHGDETENHQRVISQLKKVVMQISEKFNHMDENFYIGPQRIEGIKQIIHSQVSTEIKNVMLDSFNRFISAIIDDTSNKEFGSKMADFTYRMENISEDVFAQLEQEAGGLEKQSKAFCKKLIELDQLELRLHQNIPELATFNAIKHI